MVRIRAVLAVAMNIVNDFVRFVVISVFVDVIHVFVVVVVHLFIAIVVLLIEVVRI